METKMEKGEPIEVWFFGDSAVTGTVENVDKVTATIVFGKISRTWSVTVPRTWIRKREDRLLVELAIEGPLLSFRRIIRSACPASAFGPE